jgi:hypothetical protein
MCASRRQAKLHSRRWEIAMRTDHHRAVATHYLFFSGLFPAVRSLAFPCDPGGRVDMDEMSERARDNYLFARTVVGRDYDVPIIVAATDSEASDLGPSRRAL